MVTSYDVSAENRALLRWSLWEAQNKRCYICRNPFDFPHSEIDHVIPKAAAPKDFDALWIKFGRGMPNDGIHAINNLRACCRDCNSTAGKGRIQFSDSILDLHLAKSPRVTKDALRIQRKILRSGEVGRSAIVLASASTAEQYELIWDLDVSQAIMAVAHRASRVLENGQIYQIPSLSAPYQIELASNGKSARLLAAMQLTTGLSPTALATAVVARAVEELDDQIASTAVDRRTPVSGAAAGTTDWTGAVITVSIESVSVQDDVVTYSCHIELETNVTVPVVAQSSDGSILEDSQSQFTVEGQISILASTEFGSYVRSSPRVDETTYVDGDVDIINH